MADDETYSFWTPTINKASGPLYLAIADALQADIRSGQLMAGARLPPQRTLASALGVDFTTVTRAYSEARRRGLLDGRVGQGTYVRQTRSGRQPSTGLVDMSMNLPPRFDDALLTERLWEGVARVQSTEGLDLLLRYQQPGGAMRDREAGAGWLSDRLPGVKPENLLVCPGAQGALLAVLSTVAAPGDLICAEALTYPGFLSATAYLRLEVAAVATDEKGLVPEAFEHLCATRKPKALYCNPTIHNPTTITIPLERRLALVEIAERHDVAIIEDDAYGALPVRPVPTFAALAPGRTYHIAGLAKCLSPALRIAYLAAPDARAVNRLAAVVRATAAMASPLSAALASRWIEEGTAGEVLAAIRREAGARQAVVRELLPQGSFLADPEGFHVWLNLPPEWSRGAFSAHLRSIGIGVVASDAFAIGRAPEAVRLSLGAAESSDDLRQSLAVIADMLSRSQEGSTLVV